MRITFKRKIIFLFIVLTVAVGIMFINFIYVSYKDSRQISVQHLAADIGKAVGDLVGNLQKEREISVRLLMPGGDKSFGEDLRKQYDKTNPVLRRFMQYEKMGTREKLRLMSVLEKYNAPHRQRLKKLLPRLKTMRQEVLHGRKSFREVMQYYGAINHELLDLQYGLLWLTRNQYAYGTDIHRLLWAKEHASLERIYVEDLLLSRRYFLREISLIRDMIAVQKNDIHTFIASFSPEMDAPYRRIVRAETEQQIRTLRQALFQYRLNYMDAPRWWQVSGQRLDQLDRFLAFITQTYIGRLQQQEAQAAHERHLTWLLGLLVFSAMGVLIYFLQRLLRKEEMMLDDLRIAAFAFNSHEGMAVTDAGGTILKVNQAFSTITGYAPEEVLGQNPRILKSGRHSEEFYEAMWQSLLVEGHWSDEIINRRKSGEEYYEQLSITAIKDDQGVTTHYIVQFLDVSELKQIEKEARHQAAHDSLTQLPNRRSMLQKLTNEHSRARRHHFYDAFLFIDIDDFKKVNDVYGHAVGDQLLAVMADRLKGCIRSEDYAARISGDEFCIILTNVASDEQQAAQAARSAVTKLFASLEPPYTLNGSTFHVSASVGIKLFPDQDKTIEEIISDADTAMYHAKEQGKNRFVFFDRTIEKRMQELEQMERELRSAVVHHEFLFYYQPKVCIQTNRIIGAELLIRWNHPRRGLLYPGAFIDVLESASMLPEISRLALEQACRFIAENGTLFPGTLSINISAQELRTDRYVQSVQETITRYGIDPSRIEIEILENDLIEDFDAVVEKMNVLKDFGVQFSIDDFGIGYSSINYLHTLPVDVIKVDRAFTIKLQETRTRELVKVIVNFARVFGIKIVLEGIDEPYQLDFARKESVEMYQGFLFSEAVDGVKFHKMLTEEKA